MALAAAPPAWASVAARKRRLPAATSTTVAALEYELLAAIALPVVVNEAVEVDAPPAPSSYFTANVQPSELDAWAAEVKKRSRVTRMARSRTGTIVAVVLVLADSVRGAMVTNRLTANWSEQTLLVASWSPERTPRTAP